MEVGDIIPVYLKKSAISEDIRYVTDSYWDHSAMVFVDRKQLPTGLLVVEAVTDGIEVHQLSKYIADTNRCDIAILRPKRLKKSDREGLASQFLINHVDTPYDYIRLLVYILKKILTPFPARLCESVSTRLVHPDLFLWVTFIHEALESIGGTATPSHEHTMFTPGDLARSDEFHVLYPSGKDAISY